MESITGESNFLRAIRRRFGEEDVLVKSRLLVLTLVLTLVIGGCASQQSTTYASQDLVAPMPGELRQRVDAVVLRVVANSDFQLDLGDTLEGASSEERAKEGAEVAVGAGGAFIAAGCNPGWLFFWVFTCPAGLVVGAGVAAAGSAGASVYGGTTAWSRHDIYAAKAAWDRSKRQLLLATELRDRLISTLHETTSTRVIENEAAATATGQPTHDSTSTIVLAVDIEDFFVSEVGEDLWVDFDVSAGLYEFPDTRPLYKRRWLLYTELGDHHDLISAGGLGLRAKLDAAFDKMALAITNDLFVTEKLIASDGDDELGGEVVTTYAGIPGVPDVPDVPDVSCAKSPDREETLSSYRLYLVESGVADPESLNTQGTTGTDAEPSRPTTKEFTATLAALRLSFDRGELSGEEYMQQQRAVVDEYKGKTVGTGQPDCLRVAILPFAARNPGWNSQAENDLVRFSKEFLGRKSRLKLTYSYYEPELGGGPALDPGSLWQGNIQKQPRKPRVYAMANRLNADVALTFFHARRTADGYASDLYLVDVYVFDLQYKRMYHGSGDERHYKMAIENLFGQLIKDRKTSSGKGT